jgi:hypothetical protein
MWMRKAALSLLLIGCAPLPVKAQTVEIGSSSICVSCRVRITQSHTLRGSAAPAGFGPRIDLTRNRHGEYIAASSTYKGSIFVFDRRGVFLHSFSRSGKGPGEFSGNALPLVGRGDSLHILDLGNSRLSVFDRSGKYARGVQLPLRPFGFLIRPDGQMVVNGIIPQSRHALHWVSADGRIVKSSDEVDDDVPNAGAFVRHLYTTATGELLSLHPVEYRIDHWNISGEIVRSYTAKRSWLNSDSIVLAYRGRTPPPSQMVGLQVDQQGMVWVLAAVPDANFKPVDSLHRSIDPNEMYDTIIEVFDPRNGALLGRARSDRLLRTLSGMSVYSTVQSATGEIDVIVYALSLARR